jgi:hypothetical protein
MGRYLHILKLLSECLDKDFLLPQADKHRLSREAAFAIQPPEIVDVMTPG